MPIILNDKKVIDNSIDDDISDVFIPDIQPQSNVIADPDSVGNNANEIYDIAVNASASISDIENNFVPDNQMQSVIKEKVAQNVIIEQARIAEDAELRSEALDRLIFGDGLDDPVFAGKIATTLLNPVEKERMTDAIITSGMFDIPLDHVMGMDDAARAKVFGPELKDIRKKFQQNPFDGGFFATSIEAWKRGDAGFMGAINLWDAAVQNADETKARATLGTLQRKEVFEPIEAKGIKKLFYSSMQIIPGMARGSWEGIDEAFYGAAIGAGMALAGGAAGPQAVIPEEIVTVPVATMGGLRLGASIGSAKVWYKQGAGQMYFDMTEKGYDPKVARMVAGVAAVPYALIELSQVTKITPGLRKVALDRSIKTVGKVLANAVKKYGKTWGEEVFEEIMQEIVAVTAEDIAGLLSETTNTEKSTWEGLLKRGKRLWETAKGAGEGMALLPIPNAVIDVKSGIQNISASTISKQKVQAKAQALTVSKLTDEYSLKVAQQSQGVIEILEQAKKGVPADPETGKAAVPPRVLQPEEAKMLTTLKENLSTPENIVHDLELNLPPEAFVTEEATIPTEKPSTEQLGAVEVVEKTIDVGAPVGKEGIELEDLEGTPVPINEDNTITLYHRTSIENVENIRKTGEFVSKEQGEVFFSTKEKGQAEGFGEGIIEIKIDPSKVALDDAFSGGEVHVSVSNKDITVENISQPESVPREAKRIISDEAYTKAKKGLFGKGFRSGLDPVDFKNAAIIGTYHFENMAKAGIKGAVDFAEWSKRMVIEMGETIKPHLKDIWEKARSPLYAAISDKEGRKMTIRINKEIRSLGDYETLAESGSARKADLLQNISKINFAKDRKSLPAEVKEMLTGENRWLYEYVTTTEQNPSALTWDEFSEDYGIEGSESDVLQAIKDAVQGGKEGGINQKALNEIAKTNPYAAMLVELKNAVENRLPGNKINDILQAYINEDLLDDEAIEQWKIGREPDKKSTGSKPKDSSRLPRKPKVQPKTKPKSKVASIPKTLPENFAVRMAEENAVLEKMLAEMQALSEGQQDKAFNTHLKEAIAKNTADAKQLETDRARINELFEKRVFDASTGERSIKEIAKSAADSMVEIAKSVPDMLIKVFEPAKLVETRLGPNVYATVIKGMHLSERRLLEFNEQVLDVVDMNFRELEEFFAGFSKNDLKNFMLSRGKPRGDFAKEIRDKASVAAPEALKDGGFERAIKQIADFNYAKLSEVAGGDIAKVKDYFYGLYSQSPSEVDKFIDQYYRTTKRFMEEKSLPTPADALEFGLTLKSYNPVTNLKSEWMGIARLEGIQTMRNELMRMGRGKYIGSVIEDDIPDGWVKIGTEPVFDGLRANEDLARLINNLISINKTSAYLPLRTIRGINNVLRIAKFAGSAFHLTVEASQAVADSPLLNPASATRGFQTGFKTDDPAFKTPEYRDYVGLGGHQRSSIESESQALFSEIVAATGGLGATIKVAATPLKITSQFTEWMFSSYIPKLKYVKYLDFMSQQEKKLGRSLTDAEKINIIKEGQNFYGEMNEKLFGRSATVTSVLRFIFLAPGFAEGNYRTIAKGATQWGVGDTYAAGRSRRNVVNSLILKLIASTVGTMILTGKPPEKPEKIEDVRDLFKIDTGKVDDRGRRILIDTLTYDKDYYNLLLGWAQHGTTSLGKEILRRVGGMRAPLADITYDLVTVAFNKDIYDWKGDNVIRSTDSVLTKLQTLAEFELKKLEPISVSVLRQGLNKGMTLPVAILQSITGVRPTLTEAEIRKGQVLRDVYELWGEREEVFISVRTTRNPRGRIAAYNQKIDRVMGSDKVPPDIKEEFEGQLRIDTEKFLENKEKNYQSSSHTLKEAERIKELLVNFKIEPKGIWEVSPELSKRLSDFTFKRRRLKSKVDDGLADSAETTQSFIMNGLQLRIGKVAKVVANAKDAEQRQQLIDIVENLLNLAKTD